MNKNEITALRTTHHKDSLVSADSFSLEIYLGTQLTDTSLRK